MNGFTRWGVGLAVTAALVSGCGRSSAPVSALGGGGDSERAEIAAALVTAPDLIDESAFESAEEAAFRSGPSVGGAALAPIQPFRFWRDIRNVERRFEFAFGDTDSTGRPTTAVVTVHKLMRGSFNILAGAVSDDPADTARRVIHKSLADDWSRRLLLVRMPHPNMADRRHDRGMWRIAATSGVQVRSLPPGGDHAQILSLRVQAGALDTTITEPLQFFRLRHVLRLEAGAEVALTATTTRPDDVVMVIRAGQRARLAPNGDNTYTGTWRVPDRNGMGHFGVNALAHGTLFDSEAPYDSEAWVFPYAIASEVLAEYRP